MPRLHRSPVARGKEANFANFERKQLVDWMHRAVDDLMTTLTAGSGKPRWGEKTPAHVYQMDLIHEVYPKAQFVHILRNGRDVVRSLQNVEWSPREIRWSVNRWKSSIEAGRSFGSQFPEGLYTEVRFEELTNNPESSARSLCEFLNEPFVPEMLALN